MYVFISVANLNVESRDKLSSSSSSMRIADPFELLCEYRIENEIAHHQLQCSTKFPKFKVLTFSFQKKNIFSKI